MARKILLADDSVTAQNMGRRILVEAGYEVVTVNNGSAALKKIAELTPDLIVLDVYMPGYNGLEVCQRIKAAAETAAIPVLLTVGKLEPFKAEEARKVFADAFIIKPFEATELLNALTKLEEKIVPQPAAKAAPAKTAPTPIKEQAKKPKEDQEWKDRLRIQAPSVKAEEAEAPVPAPEIAQPAATQFRDIRHEIAAAETDEAIAQNLPANVTSEELAAITAAVSAFSDQENAAEAEERPQAAAAEFQGVRSSAPASDAPRKAVEATEYPEAEKDTEPAEEIDDQEEEPESLEAISPWANPQLLEEVAAALEQPHSELVPQPDAASPAIPANSFTDSEVDAALASLGADDIMSRLHAEEQAHVRSLDYVDAQAAAAWSEEPTTIGSTKWIAQEMRLEENEASIILEEEMHKAYAALQAEEEVRAVAAQTRAWEESDAAIQLAHESAPVEAISSIEVPENPSVQEVAGVTIEAESNSYAAAAGANASPLYADMPARAPAGEPIPAEVTQEDPELAAAWARWRQIRESVADPQFVSQVADAASAQLQSAQQQPTNGSKPAAAPDANAIASIVDSVLAQLKPKLVEEIAKQLSEKK